MHALRREERIYLFLQTHSKNIQSHIDRYSSRSAGGQCSMADLKRHEPGLHLCYTAGRLWILSGVEVGVNWFTTSSQQQATTATCWAFLIKGGVGGVDWAGCLYSGVIFQL